VKQRVVSWFSCGWASAYATLLAYEKYKEEDVEFEAVYCRVAEESEDNLKFLEEFSSKTGIPVKVIGDEVMDYSIYNVFRNRKFIKGIMGAPCTLVLKKEQRRKYQRPTDIQILGYTSDEADRVDRFIDANNDIDVDFILVTNNISKQDCMRWGISMGFKVPEMYMLGYANNNCIGCVKGGMGYWNAIRKDFPDAFNRMAKLEREIGHAINKDKNGPVYLDELSPTRGNFKRDMPGDCGFTCEVKD
jgi:hypothetical protein